MKLRPGYYILDCPEHRTTEAEVMALLRYLAEDIQSASPKMHWDFHPIRCNMHVFVGGPADSGKQRFVLAKTPQKGGFQIVFNDYLDGPRSMYTMIDLRMGPRSELEELYDQVFSAVHTAARLTGQYPSKYMYHYQ